MSKGTSSNPRGVGRPATKGGKSHVVRGQKTGRKRVMVKGKRTYTYRREAGAGPNQEVHHSGKGLRVMSKSRHSSVHPGKKKRKLPAKYKNK